MSREGRSRSDQPSHGVADTLDPGAAAADGTAAAELGSSGPRDAGGGRGTRRRIRGLARAGWRGVRRAATSRVAGHLALLAGYVAAGIAVTWPRAAYLTEGVLPETRDVASYVFGFYWVAHQVAHLGNPFFTRYMAAPVGIQLGFDTLMPLPGLLMTPVTLTLGPAVTFTVLTILTPGLLCYATYRAARLWLRIPGSIAAGAFFGLASMLAWQNWYHLNIALGSVFLPLTLEAATRLRRRPSTGTGVYLGVVLGASVLVNQESAVLGVLLAAAVLVPWLIAKLARDRAAASASVGPLAAGALVAALIAAPQLIAMAQQEIAGGATVKHPVLLTRTYDLYGVGLGTLFSPSPRLANFGLGHFSQAPRLASFGLDHAPAVYRYTQPLEGMPTFGLVLSVLAVAGLALTWRRRSSWLFALLWLGSAALALGPTLMIGSATYIPLESISHRVPFSDLMPYTWLVRIPGLSALREADRIAVLGLLGAAVLAGCTVDWLVRRRRTWPVLLVVLALGALEAGWSPGPGLGQTMRTALPALDNPIAADQSHSIVLDLPFGLRGGLPVYGTRIPTRALVLATEDGHPRSISYTSWVPYPTWVALMRHPFYHQLQLAQRHGIKYPRSRLAAARKDAVRLHIRWVLIWQSVRPAVLDYLEQTGFRYDYQVDGVTVLRQSRLPRPKRAALSGR
jgi:hypothetical protein